MSPPPADLVNSVELAGRTACVERDLELAQMPALVAAGALEGTRARAKLTFAIFDGRPTVTASVEGEVMLPCQRCLTPCACTISESTPLVIVAQEAVPVAGGFEAFVADPERLPLRTLIEEQVLLGLPLVPKHADPSVCRAALEYEAPEEEESDSGRQRPFESLRDLLGKDEH
jgi:uncharacterized protein